DQPGGWSFQFADRVRNIVLPGYTVFGFNDARVAVERMLPHGPIRIKRSTEAGGRGQTLIATVEEGGGNGPTPAEKSAASDNNHGKQSLPGIDACRAGDGPFQPACQRRCTAVTLLMFARWLQYLSGCDQT